MAGRRVSTRELDERLKKVERALQQKTKPIARVITIPPTVVSVYSDTVDDDGIVGRVMLPFGGKMSRALIHVDSLGDAKNVSIVIEIASNHGIVSRTVNIPTKDKPEWIPVNVDDGARITFYMNGENIKSVRGIWIGCMVYVDMSLAEKKIVEENS